MFIRPDLADQWIMRYQWNHCLQRMPISWESIVSLGRPGTVLVLGRLVLTSQDVVLCFSDSTFFVIPVCLSPLTMEQLMSKIWQQENETAGSGGNHGSDAVQAIHYVISKVWMSKAQGWRGAFVLEVICKGFKKSLFWLLLQRRKREQK